MISWTWVSGSTCSVHDLPRRDFTKSCNLWSVLTMRAPRWARSGCGSSSLCSMPFFISFAKQRRQQRHPIAYQCAAGVNRFQKAPQRLPGKGPHKDLLAIDITLDHRYQPTACRGTWFVRCECTVLHGTRSWGQNRPQTTSWYLQMGRGLAFGMWDVHGKMFENAQMVLKSARHNSSPPQKERTKTMRSSMLRS